MKNRWGVREKKSFRENARVIVPALLDAFLSHRSDVMAHPGMKKKLHAMRIDGKRARYGMETFADAFGTGYADCLEDVKALLDVMGTIHDHDVTIPKVRHQIQQLRSRNKRRTERIQTQGLSGLARELRDERAALFRRMGETLERWEKERFTDAVMRSMQS
jgi:CHAD domain-containing protein